jgi:hypothetical protein
MRGTPHRHCHLPRNGRSVESCCAVRTASAVGGRTIRDASRSWHAGSAGGGGGAGLEDPPPPPSAMATWPSVSMKLIGLPPARAYRFWVSGSRARPRSPSEFANASACRKRPVLGFDAPAWTTSRRQVYASDLGGPELWAVTDNVNRSKATGVPPSGNHRGRCVLASDTAAPGRTGPPAAV